MFTKVVLPLGLMVCLACWVAPALASPITYAFSGTLSQPYGGSSQFSGNFTYNTDLPLYPGIQPFPGWSYYSGVPSDPSAPAVSLAFSVGNTPSSSFGNVVNDEVIVAHTQSSDGFYIYEQFSYRGGQNLSAEIGMSSNNLVQRGPFTSTNPPSSLNLADFNNGANLTLWGTTADGRQINVVGTITSLVEVSAIPEPSSLLVFIVLGAGLFRRLRTSSCRRNEDFVAS